MSQKAIDECRKYADKIRNITKRQYAYNVIFSFGRYEIERPAGLSYMAAQAVRMHIAEIIKNNP